MLNRAEIIDKSFSEKVKSQQFPEVGVEVSFTDLTPYQLIDLFESQLISRHLDLRARELKKDNLCYYTIGSSGHEGNVTTALASRPTDMAFLHYRSAGFFIQRSKQKPGTTPIYDMLLSFMASAQDPISGGRHKVIGSHELFIPPQTSTIASHLPKAVGAALSIPKRSALGLPGPLPEDSVILCSFGDASANHSTALGSFNTAAWHAFQNRPLPLVFICEDNGIGISVKTPHQWIARNFSQRNGLAYLYCDGLNLIDAYETSKRAIDYARYYKKPVFLHMRTVRLMGHAGSDVETSYQTLQRIQNNEAQDPILHSARLLIERGALTPHEVIKLYEDIRSRVWHVSQQVITQKPLSDIKNIASAITACREQKNPPILPNEDSRQKVFDKEWNKLSTPQHMAKLINWGLTDLLLQYPQALVFGEDVAEKGGVYNVTEQLKKRFGTQRVYNSPLDEQAILGAAIGLAHNGFLPIPEIQFLAYVHNAEDQIRGEAATLAFFSQGLYTNPMVIRVAGLAYQKGFGGHFHNDNSLAIFRDIPGVILAVPSNGADAVKMLRTCCDLAYTQGRVCIFVEPIALYMTRDLHTLEDKAWTFTYPPPDEKIALGETKTYGDGETLILTYGNGLYLSLQAQKKLNNSNKTVAVMDLRWLSDINYPVLYQKAAQFKQVLFVEECRVTGSLGQTVVAKMATEMPNPPKLSLHGAADCFIPLGPAATAGLPSVESIIDAIQSLRGER